MITRIIPTLIAIGLFITPNVHGQQSESSENQIQTVFKRPSTQSSGAYGALFNKFTTFNGEFANMVGAYGGWFINKKVLIGVGAAATTNNLPVSAEYTAIPNTKLSYEFGQVGLMTEYVISSNKAVHVNFNILTGAGFTMQYDRFWEGEYQHDNYHDSRSFNYDWFFVIEPGIQVEINLLRWMRFSPGVSYRLAQGSNSPGLTDAKVSGTCVNLALKFGKF